MAQKTEDKERFQSIMHQLSPSDQLWLVRHVYETCHAMIDYAEDEGFERARALADGFVPTLERLESNAALALLRKH